MNDYQNLLRQYVDFPAEGVIFQDINPIFSNWKSLQNCATDLEIACAEMMPFCSKILAIEARGFILGSILADRLKTGFVPIRKKGKLPPYASILESSYNSEYSSNSLTMDTSLIEYNDKIIIFDDVLATGGTALAVSNLLKHEIENNRFAPFDKHNICFAFLLEIEGLKGKKHLCEELNINKDNVFSLIKV